MEQANVKTVYRPTRLDPETARLLEVIAASEVRGNQSQAVRRIIREAAVRRGLLAHPSAESMMVMA